jgi:acetyl-CoA acetyltransferase
LKHAYITGVGNTAFGRLEGHSTLDLMAAAARQALDCAQLTHHAAPHVVDFVL